MERAQCVTLKESASTGQGCGSENLLHFTEARRLWGWGAAPACAENKLERECWGPSFKMAKCNLPSGLSQRRTRDFTPRFFSFCLLPL